MALGHQVFDAHSPHNIFVSRAFFNGIPPLFNVQLTLTVGVRSHFDSASRNAKAASERSPTLYRLRKDTDSARPPVIRYLSLMGDSRP